MSLQRNELEASWSRTREHLKNAFAQLPALPVSGEESGSIQQYREWLDHNELELALDEQEMLGEANGVAQAFWEYLLQAATEMDLNDHAMCYRKKIIKV